jgi:hypothetical protein
MALLSGGQWFLSLASAAGGLVLASVIWRLPQIQRLEGEPGGGEEEAEPTHIPIVAQPAPEAARLASPTRDRRGRESERAS